MKDFIVKRVGFLTKVWDYAAGACVIATLPRQHIRPQTLFLSATGGKYDSVGITIFPRSKNHGDTSRKISWKFIDRERIIAADPFLAPTKKFADKHGDVLSAYVLALRAPLSHLLHGAAKDFIDDERRRLVYAARERDGALPAKAKGVTPRRVSKQRAAKYRNDVGLKFKIERQDVPVEKYFQLIQGNQLPALSDALRKLKYELQQFSLRNHQCVNAHTLSYIYDELLAGADARLKEVEGRIFDHTAFSNQIETEIDQLKMGKATLAQQVVDMKISDAPIIASDTGGDVTTLPNYVVDVNADDPSEEFRDKKRAYDRQISDLQLKEEESAATTAGAIYMVTKDLSGTASLQRHATELYNVITSIRFPTDADKHRVLTALDNVLSAQGALAEQVGRMITPQSHYSLRLENAEACAQLVGETTEKYRNRIENTVIRLCAPYGAALHTKAAQNPYRIADGRKPTI